MLSVVVFAACVLSAAAAVGHGSVFVSTLPPGAAVWIDGRYMGESPLLVEDLSSGRHFITLIRSGWQPQSTTADISIGRVTTLSAVLNQNLQTRKNLATGTLVIRDAGDAKVYVDGNLLQTSSNSQQLAAGSHILSVVRGNQRSISSVRIYPQTVTTVSVAPQTNYSGPADTPQDELAALVDYVPATDFVVNGDTITIHYKGYELECEVGSLSYDLNGKSGTLTVAPAMVGDKPYLPLSLLNRIAGQNSSPK